MKARYARKIRLGVMTAKLFWKEFYSGDMSQERFSGWMILQCGWDLAGRATARAGHYYRRRYKLEARKRVDVVD